MCHLGLEIGGRESKRGDTEDAGQAGLFTRLFAQNSTFHHRNIGNVQGHLEINLLFIPLFVTDEALA